MTTLRPSDATALYRDFLEIEAAHDLFALRPDGVPVWERLRFDVYRHLQRETGLVGEAHTGIDGGLATYLAGLYGWAKNGLLRNPYVAGEHEFLFYGHNRRKRREDGTWWDVYCDPIYRAGELDALAIERPYNLEHRRPARTEHLAYTDVVEYTGTMRRKAGLVDPSVEEPVRSTLAEASASLADAFDVEVDLVGRAERALAKRAATLDLYDLLVRRVDPSVAVVVMSYRKETFVEACQRNDVPVAELQHGVIHDRHLGYHFPGDATKEAFPDYLLTFGEYWNGAAEYPIDDSKVRPVGYPYLEREWERYRDVASTPQVLFVSQGTIGPSLSKVAVALSESIDREIAYKLHPGEYERWRETYPWLAEADVRVVEDDSVPLYRLFAESSVQVGVGSTAVYEGLQFDLDTYLVALPGVERMRYLVERGMAHVVDSAAELATAIEGEVEGVEEGERSPKRSSTGGTSTGTTPAGGSPAEGSSAGGSPAEGSSAGGSPAGGSSARATSARGASAALFEPGAVENVLAALEEIRDDHAERTRGS